MPRYASNYIDNATKGVIMILWLYGVAALYGANNIIQPTKPCDWKPPFPAQGFFA